MYLLTATGTFTSAQYDSIIESTKMAIDGLLNVFSALMPVYALLGVLTFGIAFVLLLFHIVSNGGSMEYATKPFTDDELRFALNSKGKLYDVDENDNLIYEDESYEDFKSRVNVPYYNPSTGVCEPMPPDMANSLFNSGSKKNRARALKEKEDYYNSHDMFGNPI